MTDRRQRQKEQRAAKRQAEKKAEQRKELGRRLTTALVFGLVVVGVILLATFTRGDSQLTTAYETFRKQDTACGAQQPPEESVMTFEAPERQPDITASTRVTATIATSCGDIVIELDPGGFPETVNSFVFLAREGFYDGQVFHRIYPDFVAQGGDPSADGTGNPGYTVPDEPPPSDFSYEVGVVAMANRGARTTGSQFFIVIGEDGRFLTNNFNVLGRVVSGQDALDRMAAIPTTTSPGSSEQSLPRETVYIESVIIDVSGS
jgi:cyclophilin family peptidyl-prolyl cis-trans isomerase